jgi:hypothetical protein
MKLHECYSQIPDEDQSSIEQALREKGLSPDEILLLSIVCIKNLNESRVAALNRATLRMDKVSLDYNLSALTVVFEHSAMGQCVAAFAEKNTK